MDLSNILKIPEDWAGVLNKQLNDSSLDLKNSPLSYSKEFNTKIDIFSLTFDMDASANVSVLNNTKDADDLNNYSSPSTTAGKGNVMLRYDLTTKLKEAISGAFKAISIDFESDQNLVLSAYKIHAGSDKLQKALLQDVASFRTIYSGQDILSLATNEGLAVSLKGGLDAELSLSYSDLFTGTLSRLLNFLPEGTNLTGTVDADVSIKFAVKIQDDFKIFILKADNNLYHLNINKAKSNTTTVAAKANISVALKETDENFEAFMNHILSAMLGQLLDQVNQWVNTGLSKLNNTEKALLTQVTQRIKPLKDIDLTDDIIRTEYEAYKTKLIDKTKEIIHQKLEAGVSYEYKKSNESNTVFKASLTEKAVKENLKTILLMKVGDLENKEGVTLINYLFSKTESITSKFGFQLAFGKFDAHWFNTQEYDFALKDDYVKSTGHASFSAQRSHSQGAKNQKEWYFKLSGQTNESSSIPVKMNDFEYSSVVHWEDKERETTTEELYDFIEMGIIWDCIESDFNETCTNISDKIKGIKDVKFSCEVLIPSPTMNRLISFLAKATDKEIILSLCSSMPHYSNKYRKELKNLLDYYSLWKLYLDHKGDGSMEAYAKQCYGQLKNQHPEIADWEYSFKDGTNTIPGAQSYQSFIGLIETSNLATGITNLRKGLKALNDAILSKGPYSKEIIKNNVFKNMDDLVTSSGQNKTFNITFLGRFLLDMAKNNKLDENITAKMTIEYKNDQNKPVEMVFMKN